MSFSTLVRLMIVVLFLALLFSSATNRSHQTLIDVPAELNAPAERLVVQPDGSVIHERTHFREVMANAEGIVVVDFWASWCGPCMMMGPELEKVAKTHPSDVTIIKVEMDAQTEAFARHFEVGGIPDVRFFQKGKAVGGFVGFHRADEIEKLLTSVPQSPEYR